MSEGSSGFQDLMDQIAGGSESAVERLLGLYGDHLCRAVRRRLNRALRPKFGTSDFVQSVWASFFRDRRQLSRFRRSSELIAFLTRVAVMAPGIYHMSMLLDQMQGKTRVTTILFYPGSIEGTTGLRFMDLKDRDALGNYRVKIYG